MTVVDPIPDAPSVAAVLSVPAGPAVAAGAEWTWDRELPIRLPGPTATSAYRPAARRQRVLPSTTLCIAALITLMFVILVVLI